MTNETCPDCAVPMNREAVAKVALWSCPACQALAIARGDVLKLRGVDRAAHRLLKGGGEAPAVGGAHEMGRACPRCQETLASFRYRGGAVRAEQCARCDLLFFDRGELPRVLAEWERGVEGGAKAEATLMAYRAGGELGDWLGAESALGVIGVVSVIAVLFVWDEEWLSLPVAVVSGVAFYFWQRRRLKRKKRRAARALRDLAQEQRTKEQAKRGAAGPLPEVDRCPWCGALVTRGAARCHQCDSDIF